MADTHLLHLKPFNYLTRIRSKTQVMRERFFLPTTDKLLFDLFFLLLFFDLVVTTAPPAEQSDAYKHTDTLRVDQEMLHENKLLFYQKKAMGILHI